ncbi:MAG: DUF418 domain-containing protein [Rubripirellula sp.]|nr:DUF418 domain-containing protein [Rubripirellula sp.]
MLDVLRGVATLGILIMNIQSFSMISSAYFNPTAYGNLENANYWGSPLISLGYVGAIMLIYKSDVCSKMTWPLARVGQMALSNYLLQTLVCTWLFYGHGFGQFGRFSRVEQMMTVLAVSALQLIISSIWLRYFRFGPFEWLWRSLSYWKPPPLRVKK